METNASEWYAKSLKDEIAELLKHYVLKMNESKDFNEDCYSEMDKLVNKIDFLIATRIDDALKKHCADSTAHNN